MESKRTFKFWSELKNNSNNKTSNNDDLLNEWELNDEEYNHCGCRTGKIIKNDLENESDEEKKKDLFIANFDCINCICGEECIYKIYYVKNKFNNNKLIVGSRCVKNFMKKNYEIYKENKNEKKKQQTILKNEQIKKDEKIKKQEEKRKQLEEIQNEYLKERALKDLQKPRCDDCLSLLTKFDICFTCKYIKPEHKRKLKNNHFIEWVEGEANKKELTGYIKLLYNFINNKKKNRQDIDKLKMTANYKDFIKESIHEMILKNPDLLEDNEFIEDKNIA